MVRGDTPVQQRLTGAGTAKEQQDAFFLSPFPLHHEPSVGHQLWFALQTRTDREKNTDPVLQRISTKNDTEDEGVGDEWGRRDMV